MWNSGTNEVSQKFARQKSGRTYILNCLAHTFAALTPCVSANSKRQKHLSFAIIRKSILIRRITIILVRIILVLRSFIRLNDLRSLLRQRSLYLLVRNLLDLLGAFRIVMRRS